MTIEDYSQKAFSTLLPHNPNQPSLPSELIYCTLGLVGESGEVAEKFKKIIRDKKGVISVEDSAEIKKELGDVVWYVNSISQLLGFTLEEVMMGNLEKVLDRTKRGVRRGSGDNR